jgi:NADPH2:quinone reductase
VVGGDATIEAVRATAPEGRVLVLGFASGSIPAVPANRLLLRNVSLTGVGLGALLRFVPDLLDECNQALARLLDGGLRPVIGSVLPLENGADALRLLESRTARGKVVLSL